MIQGIAAKQEVLDPCYAVMSVYYKMNGSDKTKQTKKVQTQIDKPEQWLANAQALMLNTVPSAAEYKDVHNGLEPEIDRLERRKVALLTSGEDYQHDLDKCIPLLQNIDKQWLAADLSGRQRLVGSIFPQKLVSEKTTYQDIGENPVLALLGAPGAGFGGLKRKRSACC